jgi:hypothetical protein
MKEVEKALDAVATMREIRDRLNARIEGMTFEEEKHFINAQIFRPGDSSLKRGPEAVVRSYGQKVPPS